MARNFSVGQIPRDIPAWQYNAFRALADSSSQQSAGLAAIVRNEMPDGSGTALSNVDLSKYLYLPGKDGGQTMYGLYKISPLSTQATTDHALRITDTAGNNPYGGFLFDGTLMLCGNDVLSGNGYKPWGYLNATQIAGRTCFYLRDANADPSNGLPAETMIVYKDFAWSDTTSSALKHNLATTILGISGFWAAAGSSTTLRGHNAYIGSTASGSLARFGVNSQYTLFTNISGIGAASADSPAPYTGQSTNNPPGVLTSCGPLVRLVNAASSPLNVLPPLADNMILLELRTNRAGQAGNFLQCVNSSGTVLGGLTSTGAPFFASGASTGYYMTCADGATGRAQWTVFPTNVARIDQAQTFTAAQTFNPSPLFPSGASAGYYLTCLDGTGQTQWTAFPSNIAYLNQAQTFTDTQTLNPSTDVNTLVLNSTNQTSGSLSANLILGYNKAGDAVFALRNTGRITSGNSANRAATDGIVRLDIQTSTNQTVNLIQCQDENGTIFSVGNRGAFVFGYNDVPPATTAPDVILSEHRMGNTNRTKDVWRTITSAGISIFRMQASGNILIGGSSTNGTNVGYEKLTIQNSTSETTANLMSLIPGTGTTFTFSKNAVVTTGRIKVDDSGASTTGIRFTDDAASPKLLAFDVKNITAGNTRTLRAFDLNGNVPVVGDVSSATSGSLVSVNLTNQGGNIATTNLTSSPAAGLYMVTTYMVTTTPSATASGIVCNINWTDNYGAQTDGQTMIDLTSGGSCTYYTILARVSSGNITYAVSGGPYSTAKYALYIRVTYLG